MDIGYLMISHSAKKMIWDIHRYPIFEISIALSPCPRRLVISKGSWEDGNESQKRRLRSQLIHLHLGVLKGQKMQKRKQQKKTQQIVVDSEVGLFLLARKIYQLVLSVSLKAERPVSIRQQPVAGITAAYRSCREATAGFGKKMLADDGWCRMKIECQLEGLITNLE